MYGFVVYGMLLAPEFGRYPGVYRSNEAGMAFLPLMFAGLFIAIVAVAIIYAKGYEGGSGAAEGARFGFLLGVFVVFAFVAVNYAVLNVGRKIAVMTAAAGFVEWLAIGLVIGLVYRPAPGSPR
jgi:hypothetical protein